VSVGLHAADQATLDRWWDEAKSGSAPARGRMTSVLRHQMKEHDEQ
jgi:hypothetical protein